MDFAIGAESDAKVKVVVWEDSSDDGIGAKDVGGAVSPWKHA